MAEKTFLGIDCGSVSLNLFVAPKGAKEPYIVYLRTRGRPLQTLIEAIDQTLGEYGDTLVVSAYVTGSARELIANATGIPAINEITAHTIGAHKVNPDIRTIIEIGGQDSKYIRIEPSSNGGIPRVVVFRMNEICAAGTGAFLDEQADRLGIPVESFGKLALQSSNPASIAGRCAVFAKTDMIHLAQEGTPIPDILLGLADALVRNYVATLIKGDHPVPLISLQGGVMSNDAVVRAFRHALGFRPNEVIVPQYFKVLGALGCAELASYRSRTQNISLSHLKKAVEAALSASRPRSFLKPLRLSYNMQTSDKSPEPGGHSPVAPIIMGLDIGSVSVKGVTIDGTGKILRQDYRLSRSAPMEVLTEVIDNLADQNLQPDIISVTGSGRYLIGRLLDSELIVNEISAQARAAIHYNPSVETVIEIGGQDSKWISFKSGVVQDFEMNRVCAAGTGSFLMAQAYRLGLPDGKTFSEAAFSAKTPSDLGTRCTVFMESDLIHHQNNGASCDDLAAGVCISIVQNYLERVVNHKRLGDKILFMGGVAEIPAVRAAFEQQTGKNLDSPPFFKVSGALGAALEALDKVNESEIRPRHRGHIRWNPDEINKKDFRCSRCSNQCKIGRYTIGNRRVFHGGLCDRWESEEDSLTHQTEADMFSVRNRLIEEYSHGTSNCGTKWAIIRSPQFYEYFPFWEAFCRTLGVSLVTPPNADRQQFESGSRFLTVETCLPIKVMAGQIKEVMESGITHLFHPAILSEPSSPGSQRPILYCPYIQGSSQFFKGIFDVNWIETTINAEIDTDALRRECIKFALNMGVSRKKAASAFQAGLEQLAEFNRALRKAGKDFLSSLGPNEQAVVVLGKPYHLSDKFLNLNLGTLFRRFGVKAIPGDLYPVTKKDESPITWKYQRHMIDVANEAANDPRLYPVMISFFGCGPDAFTIRHIREIFSHKPLLFLEMDEHSSRAGMITRIEAFLDRVRREKVAPINAEESVCKGSAQNLNLTVVPGAQQLHSFEKKPPSLRTRNTTAKTLFLPYIWDHAYAFAAAARSVGVEVHVLPPPDQESERLGRLYTVGGECHPYALILGDYLKLSQSITEQDAESSRFYILSPDACRLGQFPVYIDKVRRELGLSIGVIQDIDQGLQAFGVSTRNRQRIILRAWEGLNAYDLLFRMVSVIRPRITNKPLIDSVHSICKAKLYASLSEGRAKQGMEEVAHILSELPVDDNEPKPVIAVTGDYYTRVVPFANNEVYSEIEALGGCLWPPPTFTDSFKMGSLRDFIWTSLTGQARAAIQNGLFYLLMIAMEFKIKSSHKVRRQLTGYLDILGLDMWKIAARHVNTLLPAGITAPIATTLKDVAAGADGILNLMTLNCSYGTVVTAALTRALKANGSKIPMLTLVYDGLKKTNEKTRLEAFMEQVHDNYRSKRIRPS